MSRVGGAPSPAWSVRLEFGVPGRTQEMIQRVGDGLAAARRGQHSTHLILGDQQVAGGAHRGTEDTTAGHMHVPLAVEARSRLLGHLEAQHRPGPQRGDELGRGARSPDQLHSVRRDRSTGCGDHCRRAGEPSTREIAHSTWGTTASGAECT